MDDFIPIIDEDNRKVLSKKLLFSVFYPIYSISPDISQPNL